jgi:ABC-2 type transport system ATP-binding protein
MNPILQLENIEKSYGSYVASQQVNLSVQGGSVFGLLGPNGAGKTTLIRMITRIIFPDSGSIYFKGQPLAEKHTQQIGYMPEERGLYKKMKVKEHLIYLGMLKGLSRKQAADKTESWFAKFEIENWANKRIEELSKGMSQKVQFIGTVLHEPDFLILDEPFSGLDPINSLLIENEIKRFKSEGKAILFSTHRMEQVEEICDTIALINKGQNILNGEVKALKQQFKEHKFQVGFDGELPDDFQTAFKVIFHQENLAIISSEQKQPNEVLKYFLDRNIQVNSFKEILPTINEIFIKQVNQC